MKGNRAEGIGSDIFRLFPGRDADAGPVAVSMACRGYCEYYRGDDGEDGCNGLAVIKRAVASGKIGVLQVSHLVDVPPGPARRSGCLINELCARCSYLQDGCDFMSANPPAGASPCGGYRLLQALLDSEAISPGVVRSLIENVERQA